MYCTAYLSTFHVLLKTLLQINFSLRVKTLARGGSDRKRKGTVYLHLTTLTH